MEQRLVEPVDRRHPGRGALATAVSPGAFQLLPEIAFAAAAGAGGLEAVRDRVAFVVDVVVVAADDAAVPQFVRALALEFLFVDVVLGGGGGAVDAADFGDAEDGLPALEAGAVASPRGGEAEAGGGKGAFGPAVVDAGEVPVDRVRGGVAVELVADVDEVLHRGDVDVVDGGEVEDDGFEGGFVGFDGGGFAAAWAGVVPGPVLGCGLVDAIWE